MPQADNALLTSLAIALGGHPLSLELAAKRVLKEKRLRSSASLDSTLQRCVTEYQQGLPEGTSFKRLQLEQGDDKERNLTLSLALSYNTLDSADQQRFRALGILPVDTPFDVPLLAALWEVESTDVEYHLMPLLELGLVDKDSLERESWYTQHRLLKVYAYALLNEKSETDTIFRRYAEHLTEVASFFLYKQDSPEEWDVMKPHLPHIHAIGDTLVKRYTADTDVWVELALVFAAVTHSYIASHPEGLFELVNGEYQPIRLRWLEMGLAASRQQQDRQCEGIFLGDLGLLHRNLGNKQTSLKFQLECLNIVRELNDRQGEATVLNNIGRVYNDLGDKQQALVYYQQALLISRQVGNRVGEAKSLNNMGGVYNNLGDKQQALVYYQQALLISRQVGNKVREAAILNNMGGLYNDLGDKQQALVCYQQALLIFRQVDNKAGEASALNNIGNIYFLDEQYDHALHIVEQIIEVVHSIGAVDQEALYRFNKGNALNAMGQIDEAIESVEQAINLLKSKGLTRSAGDGTIEQFEAFLVKLNGNAVANKVIQIMSVTYQQQGEAALRTRLQSAGLPDEAVEELVRYIQDASG